MKILGSGENFGLGRKFWVGAKILGLGENFGFGRKFWIRAKILGLGRKFGVGGKILGSGEWTFTPLWLLHYCFLIRGACS